MTHAPHHPHAHAEMHDRPGVCPFKAVNATPSLADALKTRTQDAHTRAERHALQGAMVRGVIKPELYALWLVQMHEIWTALDAGLSRLARNDQRVASMLKPAHEHSPRVAADLTDLGTPRTQPTQAAINFAKRIHDMAQANDVGVLGAWYVLEGSANGGRFIAKAMAKSFGPSFPLRSLDPHGEAQRELWGQWRAGIDAAGFSMTEQDRIIAVASDTFDAITDVMNEMPQA